MKKIGILLFIALLLSSCASSRRMMRVSPFADGHDVFNVNPQRTNLFPLYYKNNDTNSALWPLIDWDKNGFAFRPLFNQEDDDLSILFPLSSWNTKNKDGWFTSFYWDYGHRRKTLGMVPLFRYEEDDFSHYGPFWLDDEKFGVFPLFGKWEDGFHFLNYIKDEDETWLLPVLYREKGRRFWFAEIYDWQKFDEQHTRHEFLSVLSRFEFEQDKLKSSYFFPLWYQKNTDEDNSMFVSPLVYSASGKNSRSLFLFPLWYSGEKKDERFSSLFPLYLKKSNKHSFTLLTPIGAYGQDEQKKSSFLVTPLFGYGSSEDDTFSFKNVLGPLYVDYKKDGSRLSSYLWPLYVNSANPEQENWHALGYLFNRTKSEEADSTLVFPLTWQSSWKEDDYEFNKNYSLLGLYHHENKKSEAGESSVSRFWPLYSYSEDRALEDLIYDTGLDLININNQENYFSFELFSGVIFGHSRNGTADKPIRTETGNVILSKGTFNDVGEDLHYSYKQDSYDVLSGHNWRFLFYNYKHNDLVYLNKDLLDENEVQVLKDFDFKRHSNNPVPLHENRIKQPRLLSLKSGALWRRADNLDDKHICDNCREVHKVLKTHGFKCQENYQSIKAAYQLFLQENLKKAIGIKQHIPLLFKSESTPKASEWKLLSGLANYKAEGDKHYFSFLKYAYKEVDDGTSVERDIFPFIKVDSGGDKSGFSFLGHDSFGFLFNWKHDKGQGHHGHFLFIPWG